MVGKNTINLVLEQKHLIFQPAHHIKSAYCSSNVTRTYNKASLIRYPKKELRIQSEGISLNCARVKHFGKYILKIEYVLSHKLVPKNVKRKIDPREYSNCLASVKCLCIRTYIFLLIVDDSRQDNKI
jgi:hypothetical protein